MLLPTPTELSNFATPDGLAFRVLVNAPFSDIVSFLAQRVLVRDDEDRELPVRIGLAAEIKALAEPIDDEHSRLLLELVSQDFPAAHKLSLTAETEREQARQIILIAESLAFSVGGKKALYDLVARTLIRCGHRPSQVAVPEDRWLTEDETLELWVSYRLATPIDAVDELVARYQAAHNPLVDFLFRQWRVVVDRNLRAPLTNFESQAIRAIGTASPSVGVVYASNDVPQTAESITAETKETTEGTKPKPPGKRGKKSPLNGPPRPRISSSIVTFLGSQYRRKTSFIYDLARARLNGIPRAAHIYPGQHAQALARRKKELDRTKKTPGYDFDIDTGTHVFGGRSSIAMTVKDIDGEEYNPETFGASQSQHIQTTDALIIPIDVDGLKPDGELIATEDAVFLARLLAQYRYRPGLPIAIVIPACDKVLSEDETAAIPNCRIVPAEFPRRLLTSVAIRSTGRIQGSASERMRHAALQNPGVAGSLNTLRIVDRFFARYEPLLREAVAITGSVEVFVTMTSTKESGWNQTYGSIEVIEWIAAKLEVQIRPALPALVEREANDLMRRLDRVASLQSRIDALEAGRESLKHTREKNTTATFVMWWNKPARLDAKNKQAEESILMLVGEIEAALGLKSSARSTAATRRAAIAAATAEIAARLRSLEGVCPRV